jgi:nitroreductase
MSICLELAKAQSRRSQGSSAAWDVRLGGPAPPRKRRSSHDTCAESIVRVRRFVDEQVPRDDVARMVELASCAASVCESQAWRFIAVQDRALIAAMRAAVLERFEELAMRPGLALQEQKRMVVRAQALVFAKAPLCVAVLSLPSATPAEELMKLAGMSQEEHDRLCVRPDLQSAGAAVQLLASAAHSMGYSACWTCASIVAGERLEGLLQVVPPARLVALVPIGRPAGAPTPRKRLPLERVLSFR